VVEKKHWNRAWANQGLPEEIRAKSSAIKRLHELTGMSLFANDSGIINADMPWELAALSGNALGSMGAYRVPQGNVHIYILFDAISKLS